MATIARPDRSRLQLRHSLSWLTWLLIGIICTLGLSVWATHSPRFPGDLKTAQLIQQLESPRLTSAVQLLSRLTAPKYLAVLGLAAAAFLLLVRRDRTAALAVTGATLAMLLTYQELKAIIDRPRPESDLVTVFNSARDASFPSGHAFAAMVVFGGLFCFAQALGQHRRTVRAFRALALGGILGVGFARIYLGAHWPSDVAGGYLFGALALFIAYRIARVAAAWAHGPLALASGPPTGRH